MTYKIIHSRGEAQYEAEAPTAKVAYRMALNYVREKRPAVRVQMPDGQTWAFDEFERIVRSVEFGDDA